MFVFCFVSPHTCFFPGRANVRASESRESLCSVHSGFAEGMRPELPWCWGRVVQTPAPMPPSWDCRSLGWRRAVRVLHVGEVMDTCSSTNGQGPTRLKGWWISFPLPPGKEPSRKFGEWDFHPRRQDRAGAENRAAGAEVLAPVPLPCELV